MKAIYEEAAFAINERRLESREVARRKVIELAADLAFIFATHDDDFNHITFYRYCGFGKDDYEIACDRNINDYQNDAPMSEMSEAERFDYDRKASQ